MDQLFCTACGHVLHPGDLFCTGCGARVADAVPSPEAPATAAPAPQAPAPADPAPAAPAPEAPDATAVRRPVPPTRPRPRRSRTAFWAWVAVAAVVVAAISYALGSVVDGGHTGRPSATSSAGTGVAGSDSAAPTGTPSPIASPDPQALAQARALRTLIVHSATDKQRIAAAATQLASCRHLAQAVQTFEDAAASRDGLVDQASGLQVDLLPGGGAAIASFSKALRAAADADRAYVAWGQARHKVRHHKHVRCVGGNDLQRTAVRLSTASHAPKQQTAQEWNVIAARFGLPRITWTSL